MYQYLSTVLIPLVPHVMFSCLFLCTEWLDVTRTELLVLLLRAVLVVVVVVVVVVLVLVVVVVAVVVVVVVEVWFWRDSPPWAMASSFTRFLDHTRRTTVDTIPLDG
jgi:hypothetical protein